MHQASTGNDPRVCRVCYLIMIDFRVSSTCLSLSLVVTVARPDLCRVVPSMLGALSAEVVVEQKLDFRDAGFPSAQPEA